MLTARRVHQLKNRPLKAASSCDWPTLNVWLRDGQLSPGLFFQESICFQKPANGEAHLDLGNLIAEKPWVFTARKERDRER